MNCYQPPLVALAVAVTCPCSVVTCPCSVVTYPCSRVTYLYSDCITINVCIGCCCRIEQDEAFARQLEAEVNAYLNWNDVMEQVKRSKRLNDAVMKYQALKRKPLTEAQARKNMIIYLKNMVGFKMNYLKGMTYSEIRPLVEKHYNYNQAFLEEVNEEVRVPKKEVEVEEATHLASKIPIVDYKIHFKRNKPYFKIIRVDEISFDTFHSEANAE
nr:hypothetical protein [Tanacetum cinerariifolium]